MAEATIRDIEIELQKSGQWDTSSVIYQLTINLFEEDGITPMAGLDGAQARFSVSESHGKQPIIQLDTNHGIVIDAELGTLNLTFTKADVAGVRNASECSYLYDLDLKDTNERIWRIAKGNIIFYGDI